MQIKDVVVLPMHPVVKETKRKQKKTHMMYNMFTEFHNMDALLCSKSHSTFSDGMACLVGPNESRGFH